MRPSLVIIRFHIRHVLRNKYVMKHLDFNLFGQSVNSRFYHGHAIISRLGFVEGERNHTVWYFTLNVTTRELVIRAEIIEI